MLRFSIDQVVIERALLHNTLTSFHGYPSMEAHAQYFRVQTLSFNVGLHSLNRVFHRETPLSSLSVLLSMEQSSMIVIAFMRVRGFEHDLLLG